jgi:putative hydrolase of the HAD superfamily
LRISLGIDMSDAHFLDDWNAIYLDEVPGVSAALAQAAARMPVYAFSNTNPACWTRKYASPLAHFKKVFVSSTIGLRKPDAAAFQFVVSEIGVPVERVVFFDDSLSNVEGARACGLQAVHVTSHADVARTLAALGL